MSKGLTITIDPADFTQSEWEEMFNVGSLIDTEFHRNAKPQKASIASVSQLAYQCKEKTKAPSTVGDMHWQLDLKSAARKLCNLIPVCAKCRNRLESMRGVITADDGALFHGRCWNN